MRYAILGDTVGYSPEPHACIELLRGYNHICVAGNHDLATIGRIDAPPISILTPLKLTNGQQSN